MVVERVVAVCHPFTINLHVLHVDPICWIPSVEIKRCDSRIKLSSSSAPLGYRTSFLLQDHPL
jgi:hypothetical protein